jgi:hypothetical protein
MEDITPSESEEVDARLKWKPEYIDTVYQLSLLGLTKEQMAKVLFVSMYTFNRWQKIVPEFADAIERGGIIADGQVVHSLFKRATGFTKVDEVVTVQKGVVYKNKIEIQVPPDAWSAVKWLALRQRALWSETHRLEITNTNININKLDFTGITTEELMLFEKLQRNILMKDAGGN